MTGITLINSRLAMINESFSYLVHLYILFRDVFAEYSRAIGSLVNRVLGLMSRGLGLEKDCLVKRIGERPNFYCYANYYPPCPEPELTLGLKEHSDITAITVLQQPDGVTGLHVKKDGNWVAVDPVPGALLIIVADQTQVQHLEYDLYD